MHILYTTVGWQVNQFNLAKMVTALQSSRLLVRKAAQMIDEDHADKATMSAMAKLKATEDSYQVNDAWNIEIAQVFNQ